jgi:hypothetical protein
MVLGSVHFRISYFYASDMENVPLLIMIWKDKLLDMTSVQNLHIMQQLIMVVEVPQVNLI